MTDHSADQVSRRSIFVRGDPLTALVIGRLRLKPWLATLIIVIGLNAPILLAATVNHLWLGDSSRVGLLPDYGWWVSDLIAVPATILFFFWMPGGINGVLAGLRRNKVILTGESQPGAEVKFLEFEDRFSRAYSHWAWPVLAVITVAIYTTVLWVPVQQRYTNWQTTSPFVFWYTVFFWAVIFSIGWLAVIRVLVAIVWFNRLFKEVAVEVRVLDPDGAGGLSPLGAFSVKIGYLIGIYGVTAVVVTASTSHMLAPASGSLPLPSNLLPLLVVYLLLAPIAFFAPIAAAGQTMREAKANFIIKIADQFEVDSARLVSLLESDAETLKDGMEKIEQLHRLHAIASRFPVWPFNTGSLVRFFSSVLLPLLLVLVPIIISLLLK